MLLFNIWKKKDIVWLRLVCYRKKIYIREFSSEGWGFVFVDY